MRYRQIHLDFQPSGFVPDVGSRFDSVSIPLYVMQRLSFVINFH